MLHLASLDWRFGLRWMLATAIAIALCTLLGPIGFFGGPLVLAIAQGYLLKRARWRFLGWGMATAVGGYVAILLMIGWVLRPFGIPLPFMVAICGAIVGLAQALVLRRDSRYWVWWPLVNALVLLVSLVWFMPSAIDAFVYGTQRTVWGWLALASLAGLIGGFLKGMALAWLLQQIALARSTVDHP